MGCCRCCSFYLHLDDRRCADLAGDVFCSQIRYADLTERQFCPGLEGIKDRFPSKYSGNDPKSITIAADILKNGGLVAIPTETVYGLGANGLNENAVAQIFVVKGRPQDNPLILHVADPEQMELFAHDIPKEAYKLAEAFWPGPLTMILPARDIVPKRTTGGRDTVGIRCPDHEVTRAIIRAAGIPVAAPSANTSGKPSTTTAEHVLHDHDGKIEAVVDEILYGRLRDYIIEEL